MSETRPPPRRSLREKLAVPPLIGAVVVLLLLWFIVDKFQRAEMLSSAKGGAPAHASADGARPQGGGQ
jgi:hypothetical protein